MLAIPTCAGFKSFHCFHSQFCDPLFIQCRMKMKADSKARNLVQQISISLSRELNAADEAGLANLRYSHYRKGRHLKLHWSTQNWKKHYWSSLTLCRPNIRKGPSPVSLVRLTWANWMMTQGKSAHTRTHLSLARNLKWSRLVWAYCLLRATFPAESNKYVSLQSSHANG